MPQHQGKGIARKLMDFAEQWAREQKYIAIRLDTFSQNERNQRFYDNRGYTNLGPVFLKYKKEHPYYCYELIL
jgi:GNAT superfamily N-acetyltransferase